MGSMAGKPRFGALCAIAILVPLGWLLIALFDPHDAPRLPPAIGAGLLLGTMFGHVSLAAGWCILGPLALSRRLPLTFGWVATVITAIEINASRRGEGGLTLLLIFAGAFLIQWLLVQSPLWLLAAFYGLRICHPREHATVVDRRDHQFGIRQLMTLTAIVAVVLGVARFASGSLDWQASPGFWEALVDFGFMAVSNAGLSLPLIAAPLVNRRLVLAISGGLICCVALTVLEISIFNMINPQRPSRIYLIVASMNAVQCTWILTILFLLRAAGYRLVSRRTTIQASAPASE